MNWEEIGVTDPRYRTKKYLTAVDKLQKDIKKLTGEYIRFVDVGEYKGDGDQMVEDIWFELFSKPVSEVCDDAIAEYENEN